MFLFKVRIKPREMSQGNEDTELVTAVLGQTNLQQKHFMYAFVISKIYLTD